MKLNTTLLALCLASVISNTVEAKCPVGAITASIKQYNGLTVSLIPTESYTDMDMNPWYETAVVDFGTIHLGPGDTLLMVVGGSECGVPPELLKDGQVMQTWSTQLGMTLSSRIYKCTSAGMYAGGCCDEGCSHVDFNIAPLDAASGPVSMEIYASLGGALAGTTSIIMRTDLLAQGLLPMTEPYTSMGYSFVGGGGETITGTPGTSTVDWVVVELRNANQPSTVVLSKAALLTKFGRIVAANTQDRIVLNVPTGYYHVAVRHRNHLGVMTGVPVLLSSGPAVQLSFTTTASSTYGTEAEQSVGNFKCLWPGNAKWTNGTQQIKYVGANNDRDVVLTRVGGATPTGIAAGYLIEDINLDGVVKYTGTSNDRDIILQTIGGTTPNAVRLEQVP